MEEQKFQELLKSITQFQARVFFLPKECALPLIDKFLAENPALLNIHDKQWYYENFHPNEVLN